MKGSFLFDWRILAASFAALLVVAAMLMGGLGFGDMADKIKDFLGGSPFGGVVEFPQAGSKQAVVVIYDKPFSINVDKPLNMSVGEVELTGFKGTVNANLDTGRVAFSDSVFSVSFPMENVTFTNINLSRISLEGTDFSVMEGGLETSGQNGTLEFSDFSGSLHFSNGTAAFYGNFTLVKGNGKQIV